MMQDAPRIAVFGAGAVGGTLAAILAAGGHDPALVARGARAAALRRDGLRFQDASGAPASYRLTCEDPVRLGKQDIVFLAVKADGLAGSLPGILPLIGPETLVVPLVNGIPWWYFAGLPNARPIRAIDPDGALLRSIAPERIIGSVVFITADVSADGVVCARGMRRLVLGALDGASDARVESLAALLRAAGVGVDVSLRIRADIWAKVALNLATNPLSVVTRSTLEDQFHREDLLDCVTAVLEETRSVAAALGFEMPMSLDQMIATGRRAGPFETSMLQDYRRGRPLELGAIADAVLELADGAGVAMPVARAITAMSRYVAERRPA